MSFYRKKPVLKWIGSGRVEAVQLEWTTWGEMCNFAGVGHLKDNQPEGTFLDPEGQPIEGFPGDFDGCLGLLIPTLEGLMIGREHDWIIRGVQGELYPCKPDIFEVTYENWDGTGCTCL